MQETITVMKARHKQEIATLQAKCQHTSKICRVTPLETRHECHWCGKILERRRN